jgi:hypothetical protein
MLTILVSSRTQAIVTTDDLTMRVRAAYIRQQGRWEQLNAYEKLSHHAPVRLVIKRRFRRLKRVQRLPHLQKAMREFFESHYAQQHMEFDCYAFVNLVHGIEPHGVTYMALFWETSPLKQPLRPGDTLFFLDPANQMFHHAAIFIGWGLCISIYGGGGDIEFSTIADMKRELKAKQVLLAKPKTVT